MPYRFYALETGYKVGLTDIYIRIESLRPMAIPVRMSTFSEAFNRDIYNGYQYDLCMSLCWL